MKTATPKEVGVGPAQWGLTGDKLEPREPVASESPVGDVTGENLRPHILLECDKYFDLST
jgi:hypothetical protein